MIFGAALSFGRKGLTQGATLVQRRMLVSLEIPSKDKAHGWLLTWMEAQTQRARNEPPLTAAQSAMDILGLGAVKEGKGKGKEVVPPPVRIHSRDLSVQTVLPSAAASQAQQHAMTISGQPLQQPGPNERRAEATFSLVPGPGTHWFRYRGAWIRLQRERNGKLIDISTGAPWETLTLTTLHASRSVFPQLLSEAQELATQSIQGKTVIYTAWGVEWRAFGQPRKPREVESVVLARGQRERILADVRSFLGRGQWYARRGIPYRRGYLLHGSPGSGKTSIIQALAGALDLNICLLNLSERGLTDDKLNHLLSLAPERSILLLEDIDAAFPSRAENQPGADAAAAPKREYQTSVTFSGLLNALDGVASGESRIVMMTTNHVERLDPALIRPGRVDLIEELGDADENMARDLFERFYSVAKDEAGAKTPATPAAGQVEAGEGAQASADGGVAGSGPSAFTGDLGPLSDRLALAVRRVALLRRSELGLDPSGRYLSSQAADAAQTQTQTQTRTEGEAKGRGKRTKATLLPAQRGGVSMAELQGLFIRYPQDPLGAVEELESEGDAGVA